MSYKVVVIDDDADILRLVRNKLQKEGFQVVTAVDGEDGLSKIVTEKPDIVLIDIMMPKKDGYQVLSEIKKMGKRAPVSILLTAKAESKDIVKGLQEGADDYITKPFSPRELIERMNVALIKAGKGSIEFNK